MIPTGWRLRSLAGSLPLPADRRERGAFRTGIWISALLHLALVALYPLVFRGPGPASPVGVPEFLEPLLEGIEVVEIVELPPAPDSPAPIPILEPSPVAPLPGQAVEVALPPGAPAPPDADDGTGGRTVAERLRPRLIDPRLWVPLDPDYTAMTDQERAQMLLEGMIRSWNDSMAVAEALSARAMDWSFTDAEGRRWGLSPGRLHLGDFSIPIPFNLALPPGRWEAMRDRAFIRDDLARGAATAVIRETWTERARAIRERLEAERAAAQEDAAEEADMDAAGAEGLPEGGRGGGDAGGAGR